MNLYLDLGNTRIKWMCAERAAGPENVVDAQDWHADIASTLERSWQSMPSPQRVVASSVVDAQRQQVVDALVQAQFNLSVEWIRTPAVAGGVRNAYAEPQRLGADRFLAMLAAFADGHAPCILASCGTAVTLDALAADGHHLGGLIAPGAPLMQQSVSGATARVLTDPSGRIVDVADNTADALVSGCWHAAAALIDRFTQRMADHLGGAPHLLLGGGDAERVSGLLQTPAQLYPNAVLRGVALWAAEHV